MKLTDIHRDVLADMSDREITRIREAEDLQADKERDAWELGNIRAQAAYRAASHERARIRGNIRNGCLTVTVDQIAAMKNDLTGSDLQTQAARIALNELLDECRKAGVNSPADLPL